MSKFKLFILWGFISFFGVFWFANANVFWDQKYVYDYRNLVTNNVNISNLHCEWVWKVDFSIWGLNFSNWKYEYLLLSRNCPFSVNGDIQWFRVNGLSDHPVVYTYVPSTPNSQMQPAINWLHDTVWEIIPYVVYIWIWVLLAILWFYWIRRLVNRIAWKINSVFRSKRN